MVFKNYDLVFASVLPAIRSSKGILADITKASSDSASDVMKKQVAEIELIIKNGDELYKNRKYEEALKAFKEARSRIYKILYPGFDVTSYLLDNKDIILTTSKAIEYNLLDASIKILNATRPEAMDALPVLGHKTTVPLDKALQPLVQTGFRESTNIEETLQLANNQGISLLVDGKPGVALHVMKWARSEARLPRSGADPVHVAALELNIGSAYLQLGNHNKAKAFARASFRKFSANKDKVGLAQALHLLGASEHYAGNVEAAKRHFKRAADILKETSGGLSNQPNVRAMTVGGRTTLQPVESRADLSVLSARVGSFVSRDTKVLKNIAEMDPRMLTYRMSGRTDGWGVLPVIDDLQRRQLSKTWKVGVPVGDKVVSFTVGAMSRTTRAQLINSIYKGRINAKRYADLKWKIADTSTTTFYITHLYAYSLLVKIGDALNALGHYKQAEANYLQASKYTYLNKQVEASLLWNRLARNIIEWGHSLYKKEDLPGAKALYAKVITENETVPSSFLYKSKPLEVPATTAKQLIQKILQRPLPSINWEIAINVLTAYTYLQQILDGLDFYGLTLSPIHTFEYLQGVARGFAQEAIQAEREFVNFKSREEAEEATRRDLETTKAMAQAEADARYQQYLAAQEDESAAKSAYDLVVKRRNDAQTQRTQYASASWTQIWSQAAAAALGGGEDAYWSEISELADKLDRGETISGPGPKLAAAGILSAGRKTRNYELQKMQDNINQLTQAINVAKDQWDGAKRRTAATELSWQAAVQRTQMADAALTAFDEEFFTSETWGKMVDIMRDIAHSYLFRAIRIAKLMERSYNFENDTQLNVIKNEYGHGIANPGPGRDVRLLGGDSLLKDIDSFTYHAITTKTRKNSRIKDVISIAADFPAQFEEFRHTGLLSIETDLYEFDRLHPGFYGQRIEAIEVQIIGVLPEGGLNGTLSLGGVTRYRKKNHTIAQRVHQVDTMGLSEFVLRNDAYMYSSETGVRGLFQGFGLGTTWQLHLPRRSNNFDFRRIFDVQLIVYYTAKFDPVLKTTIFATPLRSDELSRLRNYGLRYDFPDAWYALYQNGSANFTIDRFRLPMNQKKFVVQSMSFRVVTKPAVSSQGIQLRITGPEGTTGEVTTNTDGVISTENPQLASLVGTDPLGEWQVEAIGGAPITEGGELKFDRIYNIQIGLEYSFEYVEEVI